MIDFWLRSVFAFHKRCHLKKSKNTFLYRLLHEGKTKNKVQLAPHLTKVLTLDGFS